MGHGAREWGEKDVRGSGAERTWGPVPKNIVRWL